MSALKKILVVDDDPVIGKSFDRVLSGKGYAVINAPTGEAAIEKLTTEDYDLVVTDIRMPGMSGLEVAERVRAKQPWMPVLIVTGYGSDESEARAKAAGVTEFLRKPLSPEMIETTVGAAVAAPPPAPAATTPVAVAVAAVAEDETETAMGPGVFIKNLAMFFASPFIALAYVVLLPLIGTVMLAKAALEALRQHRETA
jgi:CheY-like chemotaxis protein